MIPRLEYEGISSVILIAGDHANVPGETGALAADGVCELRGLADLPLVAKMIMEFSSCYSA